MSETKHATLAAALVAAQARARAVAKDSENTWHKYAYASAEAIMAEARDALNPEGLACVMTGWFLQHFPVAVEAPNAEHGTVSVTGWTVTALFTTLHAASGEKIDGTAQYHVIPEKGRPLDKATATALTYAEGYYLRGLLCLPRVERGSEVDERNDGPRVEQGPNRSRATPPPSQPRPAEPKPPLDGASESTRAQAKDFNAERERLGWSADYGLDWIKQRAKVQRFGELSYAEADAIVAEIRKLPTR